MPKSKRERVSMDTEKFSQAWLSVHRANAGTPGYLMSDFLPFLALALDLPAEKLKADSVRAKCYALNKRAPKMGLAKLQVPGSGKTPGSGLPEVNWGAVFEGWPVAKSE